MFNKYFWELYLKSGGQELVDFFRNNLLGDFSEEYIQRMCDLQRKVEFYLGIMYQRAKGSRDYDIWNLPEWPRIKGCADKLFEDESFMRSLRKNIERTDLWLSYSHIDRSTKAGKMAWDTLLSAGLVTGVPKRKRYNL